MKRLILILCLVSISLSNCTNTHKLVCKIPLENIKNEIKEYFKADSVEIYTTEIKEEIYITTLRCPYITIINPTTKVLDFKSITTSNVRFENFEEIEKVLKQEGVPFADKIINECDTSEYNDLIIEYCKLDSNGERIYRFICHYSELFE